MWFFEPEITNFLLYGFIPADKNTDVIIYVKALLW